MRKVNDPIFYHDDFSYYVYQGLVTLYLLIELLITANTKAQKIAAVA